MAERIDSDDQQEPHFKFGQVSEAAIPANFINFPAHSAHHCGYCQRLFFGYLCHRLSFLCFSGEGRLALHRAKPAVCAFAARLVWIEPAKAARAGQADGAELTSRMPEAIKARAIRSLCGRGFHLRDMPHAASREVGAAAMIKLRIARLLKLNVMSAEAL